MTSRLAPLAIPVALTLAACVAGAQVMDVRPVTPPAVNSATEVLRAAQEGFESFRRRNAPVFAVPTGPNRCDEVVGRFCYWYVEDAPDPPVEGMAIIEARGRLLQQIDSVARLHPNDRWISGQRVRYLVEARRTNDAIRAAEACNAPDWWCEGLRGFAFHVAERYEQADTAFQRAITLMTAREACDWRDMKLILDDNQLRRYKELPCEEREALESRIWWLARPMLSTQGNDARTEFYARRMMGHFIEDAPSAYAGGYDSDERELSMRYGWPIAWTRTPDPVLFGAVSSLTGHERTPAHPYLPTRSVLDNPASSDSAAWRSKGVPPVRARYAPAYAKRLLPLDHQSGLFRRGDSALVIVRWSAEKDTALAAAAAAGKLTTALTLTRGEQADAVLVRGDASRADGTLMALGGWGSMLMSVEVAAKDRRTLARARYGVRRSDSPASRIQVSDIVLFEPYEGLPTSAEDALPHMLPSERIEEGSKVGIFWEAYQVDQAGEGIDISITVAQENTQSGGWLQRGIRALRRVREAAPVSVGMRDFARGLPVTARAVEVDLSTLTPGRYLLQLELDAGPGNVVRVDRAITVVRKG